MESIFWAIEQNSKFEKKTTYHRIHVQSLDDNSWMRFMSNPKFAMMVSHIIFVVANLVCVHLKKLSKHVKVSKLFKIAQMSHSLYIDFLHSGTVEKCIFYYIHIYTYTNTRKYKSQIQNIKKQFQSLMYGTSTTFGQIWKKHQSSIQVLGWHFALCNQSLGHIELASVLMLTVKDLDPNWYPAKPHQTYRTFPIWQEAAALWISFSMSQRVTPLLTFSNGMYRNRVRWLDMLRMSSP